jgi:hypothetical protein
MNGDFGRQHWALMVGMSLLAVALMFGVGFALEWLAGSFA